LFVHSLALNDYFERLTIHVLETLAHSGYGRYANALKTFLESQPFASDIKVTYGRDSQITGNFEVTIVETGKLIHSKRRGMGHQMTDSQMNAIAVHIEEALEEME
jgi:hypothetical protein